jgi:hypothetical protein
MSVLQARLRIVTSHCRYKRPLMTAVMALALSTPSFAEKNMPRDGSMTFTQRHRGPARRSTGTSSQVQAACCQACLHCRIER